jgi:hypothetical protein
MTEYYFFMCSLPEIEFGEKPDISHGDLNGMISLNITQEDQERICEFKSFIDLKNVKSFWQKTPIDSRGNLNEQKIEESLLVGEYLPRYVFDFMQKYKNTEDRIKYFSLIYSKFFQEKRIGFLNDYFKFEKEYRLILTFLRAKDLSKDAAQELFFEDQKDFFLSRLIAEKQTQDFSLSCEYDELKDFYSKNKDMPEKLHYLLLQYRFKQVKAMWTASSFDINAVLKFISLLYLAEDAIEKNKDRGLKILNTLC